MRRLGDHGVANAISVHKHCVLELHVNSDQLSGSLVQPHDSFGVCERNPVKVMIQLQ